KKKNIAVGFMTAGVVIAYTKVISTAIAQIGVSIAVEPSFAAFGAGIFNLLIGLAIASVGVTWAFKALSKVIPGVNLAEEMNNDNRAIGLFVAGVLFGLSEMIAAGVEGIGPVIAGALGKVF
ncbi:MAG: hypothetical protein KDA28_14680, partial [Phycisphaerales bacterium]|nr:hypothetical protein [Phycisphaerales bacterium]